VQSIDAKLNQQSEEVAEIKLALQRLDRPQRSLTHPTPTEPPVPPQVEPPVQTQNLLASPLLEQDSDRGNLCYVLTVEHIINNYHTCRYLKLIEVRYIVADEKEASMKIYMHLRRFWLFLNLVFQA